MKLKVGAIFRVAKVGPWLTAATLLFAAGSAANAAQRQQTRSPHGPLNIPCDNCHTNTSWAPIRAIPEFNHDSTRYPLRGMHEKVSCTGCHVKPIFTDVGKNCSDCHADIHRGQFGANCAQCHTPNGWQVAVQSIQQHFNRFPLLGAHAVVECDQCHKQAAAGIFQGLSTACQSCHLSDFQRTTNPPHKAAGFETTCQDCHRSFDTWLTTTFGISGAFDHSKFGFPLLDAHATTPCASCHINNNYSLAIGPTECGNAQCHLNNWQTTTNPAHAANATWFPIATCSTCHVAPTSWTDGIFPNHAATGFPLTLGHNLTNCSLCHGSNNYTLTTTLNQCGNSNCHLTTWQQTNAPVHSTSGPAFAVTNCSNCHTPAGWSGTSFDHSVTGFALVGTHLSTPCASCHNGPNPYTLTDGNCYDSNCHMNNYNTTTSPNHAQVGYSSATAQCAACHPITTWAQGTFNHPAAFPLTQGHANVACTLCHINNNFALTTQLSSCGDVNCHLTTWQQTNAPVHSTAGPQFAVQNCSNCHTPAGWSGSNFDHSVTGFTLVGTHLSTPCASCHTGSNPYALTDANCYDSNCHMNNYNTTTSPNHAAAGFPTATAQCAACHPITTWTAGTFTHPAAFPLTNTHATLACQTCHVNNNYTLTTPLSNCGDTNCHLSTWQGTTAPPHAAAPTFFPVATCSNCHTPAGWTGATFDHSTTGFTLTGMHVSPVPTPCTSCHTSATTYSGNLPKDCYTCHTAAWLSTVQLSATNTSVPNHVASLFPTDCSLCHSTSSWTTATFNHATTTFGALTGAHATIACSTVGCHSGANAYSGQLPITCDGCHDALYQSTATMGTAVPPVPNHVALGYPKTCDSCHNTTAWTGAVFAHTQAQTGFALTGAHVNTLCSLCHTTPGTIPNTCSGCHMDKWLSTQTLGGQIPNHVTAALISSSGFSLANCATCHNTTAWTGATFTHSWFPIGHGQNAAGGVCATCHISPTGDYSVFQCTACHGGNNAANFQHPNLGGRYVYNSVNCYQCHPNAP